MKITFKNFKQHSDRTFDLPDTGLINIAGRSGAGKTTLLRGFQFALFDGVKKPFTHGTKTCSVDLSFPGLEISRQKGPGRLVVNGTEDATAQDIIQRTLGMSEAEFMASSYIQQKMQSSLLTLSPAEQLAFIERLAFGENSPDKIKTAINAEVLSRKKDIDAATQRTEMIEKMLADQKEALRKQQENKVEVPDLDPVYVVETREAYRTYSDLRDDAAKKLGGLNLEKESPHYKLVLQLEKAQEDEKQAEALWNERLKEIEEEIKEAGVPWLKFSREVAEEKRSHFQAAREYFRLKHEIDGIRLNMEVAQEKAQKARKTIEEELASFPTKQDTAPLVSRQNDLKKLGQWIDYCEECGKRANELANKYVQAWEGVKGTKKYLSIQSYLENKKKENSEELSEAKKLSLTWREELTLLNQSLKTLTCPKCSAQVSLVNGELSEIVGDAESKIKQTTALISNNERKIDFLLTEGPRLTQEAKVAGDLYQEVCAFPKKPCEGGSTKEEVEKELQELAQKIEETNETEGKRKNLEYRLNFLAEDMLVKRYTEELDQKSKQLPLCRVDLSYVNLPGLTFEQINEDENKLAEYINQNSLTESRIKGLLIAQKTPPLMYTRACSHVEWLRKQLEGVPVPREADEITKDFEKYNSQLNIANSRIAKLDPFMQELKLWESKKSEAEIFAARCSSIQDQIEDLERRAVTLEAEKNECLAKYQGVLDLKSASEACQMEAVSGVVDSINIAAKDFLDLLFPDDPCLVSLLPYKQTKDSATMKARFSTVIQYKGCEYGDIDEVSGGEYDRIVLAYQLALNSIYNSPILLLDEAFTAVEEELFLVAMEALRVVAKDKLILVISHGANTGVFDQVIEM